ncbi:hypothetical protein SERLA73DRAFT_43524, partial [Serpula lacrymans var. lacrymans S7.3]
QPSCPCLEYSEVINYATLGEFALLKHSRHNLLQKPWAIPTNREMTTKHYKVLRAREEIVRLNVEIRQLQAWIDYKDRHMQATTDMIKVTEPLIAAELQMVHREQCRINSIHWARLHHIYKLDGYSG